MYAGYKEVLLMRVEMSGKETNQAMVAHIGTW